jgi:hypothetical protein
MSKLVKGVPAYLVHLVVGSTQRNRIATRAVCFHGPFVFKRMMCLFVHCVQLPVLDHFKSVLGFPHVFKTVQVLKHNVLVSDVGNRAKAYENNKKHRVERRRCGDLWWCGGMVVGYTHNEIIFSFFGCVMVLLLFVLFALSDGLVVGKCLGM